MYAWSDCVPTQCSFAFVGTSDWMSGCVADSGWLSAVIVPVCSKACVGGVAGREGMRVQGNDRHGMRRVRLLVSPGPRIWISKILSSRTNHRRHYALVQAKRRFFLKSKVCSSLREIRAAFFASLISGNSRLRPHHQSSESFFILIVHCSCSEPRSILSSTDAT
jgi:hypothetical protein